MAQPLQPIALLLLGALLAQAEVLRPAPDCIAEGASAAGFTDYYTADFQIRSSFSPATPIGFYTRVDLADDYSVTYYTNYKIFRNKKVDEYYVLYQCGSPKPDASAPGVAGLTSPRYFQIPLYKTAVMDSNAAAFMVELDVVDRVESAQVYSVNSCLQKVAETCNHVASSSNAAGLAVNDAIFGAWRGAVSGALDDKAIVFSSYSARGALQRAEWIKAMAAFFNKELEAQAIFERVRTTYNGLKRADTLKRTLWITYSPVSAYQAVASIAFSWADYKVDFSRDAGAPIAAMYEVTTLLSSFISSSSTAPDTCTLAATTVTCRYASSAPLLAALKAVVVKADVIIDETYFAVPSTASRAGILANYRIAEDDLKVPQSTPIVRVDGILSDTNGYDWFEQAVARPDLVLDSLRRVIDAPTVSHRWFRVMDAPHSRAHMDAVRGAACVAVPVTGITRNQRCETVGASITRRSESSTRSGRATACSNQS